MPKGVYRRPKLKTGPTPILNDQVFKEIKKFTLQGQGLAQIARSCNLNEDTFYVWHSDNYLNLADKIEQWRRDRKLALAEKNLEKFLSMKTSNIAKTKDGDTYQFKDAQLARIKADISKFVAETLGNKHYAKVNRLADADGGNLSLSDLFDKADDK